MKTFAHKEKRVCKEEVQEHQSVDRRSKAKKSSRQGYNDSNEGLVKHESALGPLYSPDKFITSVSNQIQNLS